MPKPLNLYGKITFNRGGVEYEAAHFSSLGKPDIENTFKWRTDPKTARWMYTSAFTLDQHFKFVRELKQREDAFYWLLSSGGENVGVFYITGIKNGKGELGLYAAPDASGAGGRLMAAVIYFGFELLKLNELLAEVYEDNVRACRLYDRSGMSLAHHPVCDGKDNSPRRIRTYSLVRGKISGDYK